MMSGRAVILLSPKLIEKDKSDKKGKSHELQDKIQAEDKANIKKISRLKPSPEVSERRPSYFFQYVSREKRPLFIQKPFKTPDIGLYRPNYDSIFSRTQGFKYRAASLGSPESTHSPSTTAKSYYNKMVSQFDDGRSFDKKIRDLKKKIDKMRELINNANIDIQALYDEKVIDEKIYNMFKSPSLKLLQKFENNTNTNEFHNLQQNPNQLINLINQYYDLKYEMYEILKLNNENNMTNEMKIKPTSPIKFDRLIQKSDPFHLPVTHCDAAHTPLNIKTSYMNDTFRKIHKFDSGSPRKVFQVNQQFGKEYYITSNILDKVRPKTGGFVDFKRFMSKKFPVKHFLNSSVDCQDLANKTNYLRPNTPMLTLMSTICGRDNHKFPDIDRTCIVNPIPRSLHDNNVFLIDKRSGREYDPLLAFKQQFR